MQARLWRTVLTAGVLSVAFATLMVATAGATHIRPQGASPKYDQLAIDYKPCPGPGPTVHGGPATSPLSGQLSCPPVKESPNLTVGTPDANGVPAQFGGFIKQSVSTSQADINVQGDMTDIRCDAPIAGNPALCQPNGPGPLAYQGETDIVVPIDVTDHCNYGGAPGPCPAPPQADTVVSTIVLHFTMPCAVPAAPNIGGECQVMTSWNTVYPGLVPPASPPVNGSRMNIEVGQVRVEDGGLDGKAAASPAGGNDNRPFAIQGLFSP